MILLKVNNINTYYGFSHILFGVSLEVNEGEAVFLLGRNGVGKTTTLKSIMGIVSPKSGRISFEGREIAGLPTHEIARSGISYVPEERRIIEGLTVQENLEIASMSTGRSKRSKEWTLDRVYQLFPILKDRRQQQGTSLSGGEQQILAITRALMSNPKLILIDEPTEGLSPIMAKVVGEQLIIMKKNGLTILCVDDDPELANKVGDRVFFMEKGQTMWEGTPQEILQDKQKVAKQFLGVI